MKLELTETIHAPQEIVWGIISDFEGAATNIEAIQSVEMVTPGPVGKGTRFKETRVMFGKQATEEMEVTAIDPPDGYTVEAFSCGAHFRSTYTLSESSGVTTLHLLVQTEAQSMFARIMGPVMGWMMTGSMKKAMSKDHADIRRAAEARAV